MIKPIVAIVGRPNVGKSTFFNRICKQKISIIEDTPGVTRDRIYADATWLNYTFTLVDTGGIEPASEDIILKQMKLQAELAIASAQVILFFVDAKQGLVPADYEVAELLRKTDKPVIVVVNKVETKKDEEMLYDFYALGIGDVFGISAAQGLGLGDLLDDMVKYIDLVEEEEREDEEIKIALLGKPNVGKSSLANRILGTNRHIVSDIPGTTRDAVDSHFVRDGREYTIIDTAGMRKKARIEDKSIERYSVIRSLMAMRRADVVIVLIDATQGITEQDVKIAGQAAQEGKPCIIAVNKWDAVEKDTYTVNRYNKDIQTDLAFMSYAPILYISAKEGQRVDKLFPLIHKVVENAGRRITTGLLNDCIREATLASPPPSDKGRRLKLFYATQVAVCPPAFVIFVNDETLMHFSYKRYLENYLRKTFDFEGTPIKLFIRERNESKEGL